MISLNARVFSRVASFSTLALFSSLALAGQHATSYTIAEAEVLALDVSSGVSISSSGAGTSSGPGFHNAWFTGPTDSYFAPDVLDSETYTEVGGIASASASITSTATWVIQNYTEVDMPVTLSYMMLLRGWTDVGDMATQYSWAQEWFTVYDSNSGNTVNLGLISQDTSSMVHDHTEGFYGVGIGQFVYPITITYDVRPYQALTLAFNLSAESISRSNEPDTSTVPGPAAIVPILGWAGGFLRRRKQG